MIIKHTTKTPESLVLCILASALDVTNAGAFRDETSPLVAGSSGKVSLDCSKLEFIDSSGVGALLHANKLLPPERRPVCLTGVGSKIMAQLELMHVHRSFVFEE